MKIGNLLVNAAYLGERVLTAIAVGTTKVWEGVSKYIKFKDPVVEQLCMKWSSDGIGLTPEDAAKMTNIGTTFSQNNNIIHFNEFEKFTGVTSLGTNCFYNCKSLETIILPNTILSIGANAFLNCTNLTEIDVPDLVRELKDDSSFRGCSKLSHINISEDSQLEYIGAQSFSGTIIETINIPHKVTHLGTSTFGSCKNLKWVLLPDGITSIPDSCFISCSMLESINIPASTTNIGVNAFAYCSKISVVLTIPGGVEEIKSNAFWSCSRVPAFIVLPATPPTFGSTVFNNTGSAPIYVPDESVEAYKSATNWSAYADRIKPLSEYVEPTN